MSKDNIIGFTPKKGRRRKRKTPAEVFVFTGEIRQDFEDPKLILKDAMKHDIPEVIVIGFGPEGLYMNSTYASMADVLYLLDIAKHKAIQDSIEGLLGDD